jgi:HK97 family phage portal protein
MQILGYEIGRKELALTTKVRPASLTSPTLSSVSDRGWWRILESFSGAWQRNVEINLTDVTSHFAVFSCMTLIAGDISKLGAPCFKRLVGDIWEESKSPAYDPVLREPNQFQTPNQFWESWVLSKLWKGNTYVLKGRDERRVVTQMWVLDPCAVTVLVSDFGDVFYQVRQDNLSGLRDTSRVYPASEIIHDRMNPLFHPLVGISPLYAAALAAQLGLNIQNNSAIFNQNRSIPGGIITTPNTIPKETAERLKREWETRYGAGGDNTGHTAVLGDGLEFKPMALTAEQSQMVELAKASAEWVCSAFHVPPYKVGVGAVPGVSNVQALNLEYYSEVIQKQLEDIEACLLRGLEMKPGTKVEFDIDNLLRMDTISQVQSLRDAVGAGIMAPDEARAKLDLPPVPGGESPYMQQQNFSLEALAKRDTQDNPFGPAPGAAQSSPPPDQSNPTDGADNVDGTGDGTADTQRHIIPSAKDIFDRLRAYDARAA